MEQPTSIPAGAPTGTSPMPSILSYTQPVGPTPRMPTTYYPGPAGEAESDFDAGESHKCIPAVTLAVAIVLAIVILYYVLSPRTLARGLARCGWTVYLREGCGYCRKQMQMLEGFDRFVLYGTDGGLLGGYTRTPPLAFGTIKGFPYWYNLRTGETRVGFQSTASLGRMAQW